MPVIRIEFDDAKVDKADVAALAEAVHGIFMEAAELNDISDVVVYANTAQIKFKVHPIEIWVQVSAHKIKDLDALMAEAKSRLAEWKEAQNFTIPITLSINPENWKIETGI